MAHLDLVTIIVRDYDRAIDFFVGVLGFELVDDSPSLTNDGRPKRWVVVQPPKGQTGIRLAQADGKRQDEAVGNQVGNRVGFFLRVDNFEKSYEHMVVSGVEFLTKPRVEPYGKVAVFLDLEDNRWDLLST